VPEIRTPYFKEIGACMQYPAPYKDDALWRQLVLSGEEDN